MSDFMLVFGFFGVIVFSVWLIIAVITKNPRRSPTIGLLASTLLFFVGVIMIPNSEEGESPSALGGLIFIALISWGIYKIVQAYKNDKKLENIHKKEISPSVNELQLDQSIVRQISIIEKKNIEQYWNICYDCQRITNTTTNPETFFSRYDLMIETTEKLCQIENIETIIKRNPYTILQEITNIREGETNGFIERYAKETRMKMYALSSEKGKINKAEAFKNILMEYQEKMTDKNIDKVLEEYQNMQRYTTIQGAAERNVKPKTKTIPKFTDEIIDDLNAELAAQDKQFSEIQTAEKEYEESKDIDALISFWENIWENGGLYFRGSYWTFRLPDLYIKQKRYDEALEIVNSLTDPIYQDKKEKYIEKITNAKSKMITKSVHGK